MLPLIFGLFAIINAPTSEAQQLVSPCPSLFTYEPEGVVGDHWYGNIRFVQGVELSGLWLRTVFDAPPLKIESNFGEVVQREPTNFLIRRPKNKIAQGETISIRIKAQFDPTKRVPQLIGFRVNAEVKCPENGVIPEADVLISPCPALFSYEPPRENETDRWYGNIQLKSTKELNGVWLRVILDKPSSQLGNWFGEVSTEDNKEYLIKNRNYKLRPGDTKQIRFFIKYNAGEPIPKLQLFRLNAEQVCPETGTPNAQQPQQPQPQQPRPTPSTWVPPVVAPSQNRPVYGGDFDPNSRPNFLPFREPKESQCGIAVSKPNPLITYGEPTIEGQWPWHAALYYPDKTGIKYKCGASLVSLTHIITAGHCVAQRLSNAPISNEDIEIYLGKWSLKKFSSKRIQNIQVKKIFMHPEYDHTTYRNDIALIQLIQPAEYTDWVRPVCLWSENTDVSSVVNQNGTVVGWGYDQTGSVSDLLNKAVMPVVPHDQCIWSNAAFFSKFATNTTFCAGDRKGTSVCNGDSGGGLVFPKRNSPNQVVWQIRGLVSISIALQSDLICDTSHYAIFTDVAKYLDWIRSSMLR